MIFLPYSTALTLARPPFVTYAITGLCLLVFLLQLTSPISENLMYSPQSWNPLTMVLSTLAHANWLHLLGNILFFLAFAPALEVLIGNSLRFIGFILMIALVTGISYSVFTLGASEPLPTLGLSGIVTSMIGLSAFLMPHARIRVFGWFILFWKTFYVPAWILAVAYIGLDVIELLSSDSLGGINLVAHVAGGIAGYLYGHLRLKDRKEEIRAELAEEIEEMKVQRQHGSSNSMSFRGRHEMQRQLEERNTTREHDRYMRQLYQRVTTHRHSEAINAILEKYDPASTPSKDYESLFEHIRQWGASRTLLCLGRLLIHRLDREKRYGRALYWIEQCQLISEKFILADLSRTLFYADMAIDTGKMQVARNLISEPESRFGKLVDGEKCLGLLQRAQ